MVFQPFCTEFCQVDTTEGHVNCLKLVGKKKKETDKIQVNLTVMLVPAVEQCECDREDKSFPLGKLKRIVYRG